MTRTRSVRIHGKVVYPSESIVDRRAVMAARSLEGADSDYEGARSSFEPGEFDGDQPTLSTTAKRSQEEDPEVSVSTDLTDAAMRPSDSGVSVDDYNDATLPEDEAREGFSFSNRGTAAKGSRNLSAAGRKLSRRLFGSSSSKSNTSSTLTEPSPGPSPPSFNPFVDRDVAQSQRGGAPPITPTAAARSHAPVDPSDDVSPTYRSLPPIPTMRTRSHRITFPSDMAKSTSEPITESAQRYLDYRDATKNG